MNAIGNSNIHRHLDEAFAGIAMTPELHDLKEEIRGNLAARVDELTAGGMDDRAAASKAIDELGDIRELIGEFDSDEPARPGSRTATESRGNSNDAYRLNRVRPKPAFVVRTVILSVVVLATAILIALDALGVLDWPSAAIVLAAVLALALPGGAIAADSLRQETTIHYPLPAPRSRFYGACTALGLLGLASVVLYVGDPAQLGFLVAGVILVAAAIIGFVWLGTTQTNRTKPWARAAARQYQVEDQFSQNPAAAARFGLYTVVIWLLAFAAFAVLSTAVGFAWSWLALLAGFVVFMLTLARMLFPPDRKDSHQDH
jgi:hypothetical protein